MECLLGMLEDLDQVMLRDAGGGIVRLWNFSRTANSAMRNI